MDNGEQAARAQALELLEQRNYREALSLLNQHLTQETDGEGRALLGLAHYHLEEYASAVEHYSAALEYDGGNQDWPEMLATARANVIASVDVPVPDPSMLDAICEVEDLYVSVPEPPSMVSAPVEPWIVSLPAPASIVSALEELRRTSTLPEPVMV